MDDQISRTMEALNDLLEAERETLLSGKLDALADMVAQKEHLIERLGRVDETDADLTALKLLDQKVKRNQLLLDGALDGIRSVARRLAALRRVRVSLDTYDASGSKREIDIATEPSVERRA